MKNLIFTLIFSSSIIQISHAALRGSLELKPSNGNLDAGSMFSGTLGGEITPNLFFNDVESSKKSGAMEMPLTSPNAPKMGIDKRIEGGSGWGG